MIHKIRDWVIEGKTPWRLRIAGALARGFLRDPMQAFRRMNGITVDMKSVYRFKLFIHGKDFLRDFMKEASILGLRPFLLWGTLLGCEREGQFIEHDYDIDLAVLEGDYQKKDSLIRAMLARGYRLRHDVPYAFSFETKDRLLHLDVDLLFAKNGKLIASMPSEDTGLPETYEFEAPAIGKLQKKVFLGDLEVWVPEHPDRILTAIYGDWSKPVKEYDYRTGTVE